MDKSQKKLTAKELEELEGLKKILTDLQVKFAYAFIVTDNQTKAAQDAGYSGDYNTLSVTGHDNIRNPKIARLIYLLRKESGKLFHVTKESIEVFLQGAILANPLKYIKMENVSIVEGKSTMVMKLPKMFDPDDIPDEIGMLINSVTVNNKGYKITFFNKEKAIELLNRMKGWNEPEEVKLSGSVEYEDADLDKLKELKEQIIKLKGE